MEAKSGSGEFRSSFTTTNSITINSTTNILNQWGSPSFLESKEIDETIEFIYKQVSNNRYPSSTSPIQERIFKIVYSCKDGKWNKSEPIYGKIIPSREEYYEFEE